MDHGAGRDHGTGDMGQLCSRYGHDVAQRVVGDGLTWGHWWRNGSISHGPYEGELHSMVGQTAGHRDGRWTDMGDRLTARHTQPVRERGDDPGPQGHEGSPILERWVWHSEQMAR
jgi:hypothetical protein